MSKHFTGWLIWPLLARYFHHHALKDGEKLRTISCKLCIPLTGGCCNFALDNGWKIFVFPWEVKRIVEYTGKAASEFIDTGPLASGQMDYISSDADKDPLWVRLFSLWGNPSGFRERCPFVSRGGCRLPYQIKPFICQVFPLDFNITYNRIDFRWDMECLLSLVSGSEKEITCHFDDCSDHLNERFKVFRAEFLKLLDSVEQRQATENMATGIND